MFTKRPFWCALGLAILVAILGPLVIVGMSSGTGELTAREILWMLHRQPIDWELPLVLAVVIVFIGATYRVPGSGRSVDALDGLFDRGATSRGTNANGLPMANDGFDVAGNSVNSFDRK
jgi:hypothetical protein